MHSNYNAPYTDLGRRPDARVETATLLGGSGYMFNKNDTPAQIEAGIKFLNYEFLTSGIGQFNYQRLRRAGQPVGLPEPDLFGAGGRRPTRRRGQGQVREHPDRELRQPT